jgi:hypothetical protein
MNLFLKMGFSAAAVLLFASVSAAYELTLAWDANTELDLAGYVLYGKEGSPDPPYAYIDTYPLTVLADPLDPKCEVTDLQEDVVYFFVVTAYDTHGNESDYSNVVSWFVSSKGEVFYPTRSSSRGSNHSW